LVVVVLEFVVEALSPDDELEVLDRKPCNLWVTG
jgi:hypothetical protein